MIKIEEDESGRSIWNRVKTAAGWKKSLHPTCLMDKNGTTTNPTKMSNIINNFFIKKIDDIQIELSSITGDPTSALKTFGIIGNQNTL